MSSIPLHRNRLNSGPPMPHPWQLERCTLSTANTKPPCVAGNVPCRQMTVVHQSQSRGARQQIYKPIRAGLEECIRSVASDMSGLSPFELVSAAEILRVSDFESTSRFRSFHPRSSEPVHFIKRGLKGVYRNFEGSAVKMYRTLLRTIAFQPFQARDMCHCSTFPSSRLIIMLTPPHTAISKVLELCPS